MTTYNSVLNIIDGSANYTRTRKNFNLWPPNQDEEVTDLVDLTFLHPATDVKDAGVLESSSGIVRPDQPTGPSWRQVRDSRLIKMTNYDVYSSFTNKKILNVPMRVDRWVRSDYLRTPTTGYYYYPGDFSCALNWRQELAEADIDNLSLPHYGSSSAVDYDQLEEAENTVRQRVVSDSYQTWDALTSVAELPKTLKTAVRLVKAISRPLQSIKYVINANKKRTSEQFKEASSVWLEARYGIRPAIFELDDILKLIAESGYAFKTSRSSKTLDFTNVSSSVPNIECTYDEYVDTMRVGAVGKAKFSPGSTKVFDQVSFNPAQTAWELIPYSFVVDWFINVGSWIESRSLELGDMAQQRLFCHSIKHTSRTRRFYRRRYSSQQYESYNSLTQPPVPTLDDHSDYLMQESGFDVYTRRLFSPTDVKLSFKPNLNWAKFVDGITLSSGAATKALRRLRL